MMLSIGENEQTYLGMNKLKRTSLPRIPKCEDSLLFGTPLTLLIHETEREGGEEGREREGERIKLFLSPILRPDGILVQPHD